jgi:hypothetical protein
MTGLLLRYNKVHDDSLLKLESRLNKNFDISWGDLSKFGSEKDLLPEKILRDYLDSFKPVDFMLIGDVFWKTGQNLCKICHENNIPLFFMQHGQWIYVANKKELEYYPSFTFLFGNDVHNVCSQWPYGKHSALFATGSPRYDFAASHDGSYIYFSPPVIEEVVHGNPSGRIRSPFFLNLKKISGVDKGIPLVIQPHYREARIGWLHELFPSAQFADPGLDSLKLVNGASKVLTSRNSTTVLDAIAHQKMTVLMDMPENDECFFPRGYFGEFALESSNKSEVVDNLTSKTPIKSKDYTNRAKKYICLGNASARIVSVIKDVMYNQREQNK